MTVKLSDYIRELRAEKKLSLKDVERASGGEISSGYVNQIENGDISSESISVQKIKALARGLAHSEERLFRVARGLDPQPFADELYFDFDPFGGVPPSELELIAMQAYLQGLRKAVLERDKAKETREQRRNSRKTQ